MSKTAHGYKDNVYGSFCGRSEIFRLYRPIAY